MVQLLITVFAIGLTALLLMASLNYYPWWYKTADAAEELTKTSLHILEQGYDVVTRANNGVPPVVVPGDTDGGFAAIFGPALKILPAPVPRFNWKYGEAGGFNYFCMESTGTTVNEGAIRGILRAKSLFSETQVYVNTDCGAQTNMSSMPKTVSKLSLTMFVAFVPGISK